MESRQKVIKELNAYYSRQENPDGPLKISEYFSVNEAANFLGVTKNTLRNWDADKKITPYRNPINNYRLYKKEDLEVILGKITRLEE